MRKLLFRNFVSLVSIFILALAAIPASAQTPSPIIPTDTNYDSRVGLQMGNLPSALGLIQQKEESAGANHNTAIVALLDTGVEASHPDLAGQVVLSISYVPNTAVSFLHGTGMAGFIAALINGQFIVSPGGLFPGRVQVADVHWANDETDATATNLRQGLQQILNWKLQGYNIVAVNCSFGFSQIEDNPKATKALLTQLKNSGIYCVSPEGGIIGSYVNDPDCAVITVSSLNEQGNGFDQLSGGGFGGMITGPGGVMHQLIAINGPSGGQSSGVLTTGGVSATTAIIAGCIATVVQYGKKGDVVSAVEAIIATSIPFTDTDLKISGKRIDLFAALQYDPDGPSVSDVVFDLTDPNRMVVKGRNFGLTPQVMINGQDASSFIKNAGNTKKLKLKGDIQGYLHGGQNTIQVNGSSPSNLFILTL